MKTIFYKYWTFGSFQVSGKQSEDVRVMCLTVDEFSSLPGRLFEPFTVNPYLLKTIAKPRGTKIHNEMLTVMQSNYDYGIQAGQYYPHGTMGDVLQMSKNGFIIARQ